MIWIILIPIICVAMSFMAGASAAFYGNEEEQAAIQEHPYWKHTARNRKPFWE